VSRVATEQAIATVKRRVSRTPDDPYNGDATIYEQDLAADLLDAREKIWALEINAEETDEISAQIFDLCCAILDGRPEAAKARESIRQSVEHIRSCRKGSCAINLGEAGARATIARLRADLARLQAREGVVVAEGVVTNFGDNDIRNGAFIGEKYASCPWLKSTLVIHLGQRVRVTVQALDGRGKGEEENS